MDWIYFIGWLIFIAIILAVIYKGDPEPESEGDQDGER